MAENDGNSTGRGVILLLSLASRQLLADELGKDVIAAARTIPYGGGYIWEDGSGSPRDVLHDGATILRASRKVPTAADSPYASPWKWRASEVCCREKRPATIAGFKKIGKARPPSQPNGNASALFSR